MNKKYKAIFLDRDGIINKMIYDPIHGLFDSPKNINQIQLANNVPKIIKALHNKGFLIIVVTNQPGICKKTLTVHNLNVINKYIYNKICEQGAKWDDLYYCPHDISILCNCRKPKPGMLFTAAQDHCIDLKKSWMIGDGIVDIEAGKNAGCKTILVTSLKLEQIEKFIQLKTIPDFIVKYFEDILKII